MNRFIIIPNRTAKYRAKNSNFKRKKIYGAKQLSFIQNEHLPQVSALKHVSAISEQRYNLENSRRYMCALQTFQDYAYFGTKKELDPVGYFTGKLHEESSNLKYEKFLETESDYQQSAKIVSKIDDNEPKEQTQTFESFKIKSSDQNLNSKFSHLTSNKQTKSYIPNLPNDQSDILKQNSFKKFRENVMKNIPLEITDKDGNVYERDLDNIMWSNLEEKIKRDYESEMEEKLKPLRVEELNKIAEDNGENVLHILKGDSQNKEIMPEDFELNNDDNFIFDKVEKRLQEANTDTITNDTKNEIDKFKQILKNLCLVSCPIEKRDEFMQYERFMLDAADILPIIALQPREDESVYIHYEQAIIAGHDGRKKTEHEFRLGHYLRMIQEGEGKFNKENIYQIPQVSSLHSYKNIHQESTPFKVLMDKKVSCSPFDHFSEKYQFDKVIVEGPSNIDREAINDPDIEINPYQYKIKPLRSQLPHLLESMLVKAVLNAKEDGGEIIYTTRTLNPVHNEFMVQFAIETLREDFNIAVQVDKMDLFKNIFKDNFDFEETLDLGCLIVPTIFNNWGPRYICKLKRVVSNVNDENLGQFYSKASNINERFDGR